MPNTPCECTVAGLCQRHKCVKTDHWFHLCQTRQDYFDQWERGESPLCLPGAAVVYCEWKLVDAGKKLHICQKCGNRWNGNKPRQKPCGISRPKRTPAVRPQGVSPRSCCGGRAAPPIVLEVKPPGGPARVVSFLKEMGAWSLEGFPLADEARRESRHLACSQCKFRDGDWCMGCGCYLPFAQKVATKHCPMALWPGESDDWTPQAHVDWLKRLVVIMPVCGNEEFTKNAVADCEREGVDVHVIDGCQRGWLGGTNYGLEEAMRDSRYDFFVMLNNDVRLSRGFFAGLLLAYVQTGADMITACYNVGWTPQKPTHQDQPSASEYRPRPVHRQVPLADGTCCMVTRRLLTECGYLDHAHFGKYGHAATGDLAIRAKMRGMTVYATEAAYCYHYGMQTAMQIHGDTYMEKAQTEAREGLVAKWGPEFSRLQSANRLLPPHVDEITVRNCAYHVYPHGDTAWWNIAKLLERVEIFNGKRVACVVTGDGCDHVKAADLLGKHNFTIMFKPNGPLYDSVGINDMLQFVRNENPHEATFVGHTKGSGRSQSNAWAEQMYEYCLNRSDEAMLALRDYACVGTAMKVQDATPIFTHRSHWHYSGSFYWLRHDAFFSRPWFQEAKSRYWIEAIPGTTFESWEAYNAGPMYGEQTGW